MFYSTTPNLWTALPRISIASKTGKLMYVQIRGWYGEEYAKVVYDFHPNSKWESTKFPSFQPTFLFPHPFMPSLWPISLPCSPAETDACADSPHLSHLSPLADAHAVFVHFTLHADVARNADFCWRRSTSKTCCVRRLVCWLVGDALHDLHGVPALPCSFLLVKSRWVQHGRRYHRHGRYRRRHN